MKTEIAPAAPAPNADRLGPGFGQAVVLLLGLQIVTMLLEILARLHRLDLWLTYRAGGFISQPQADQADRWISRMSWIGGLAFIVTIVVWLVWQHRAQTNAIEIAGERLQFTPGWAVGWWFIPFANLGKPFQAVRELWKASHGSVGKYLKTQRLIGWWWATWLATVITIGFWNSGDQYVIGSSTSSVNTVSNLITTDRYAVVRLAVRVIAAVLAIWIVRSVTRLQMRAFAEGPSTLPAGVFVQLPGEPGQRIAVHPLARRERAWILGVVIAMGVLAVAGIAWTARAHVASGEVPTDVPIAIPPDGDLANHRANGVRFSYPSSWIMTETASHGTRAMWPDPMWSSTFTLMSEPQRVGVITLGYRLRGDPSEMTEEQRRALVTDYAQRVADELPGTATTSSVEPVPFGQFPGYRIDAGGGDPSAPVTAQINVMFNGPFAYVVRCQSTPTTTVDVAVGCASILSTYDVIWTPPARVP